MSEESQELIELNKPRMLEIWRTLPKTPHPEGKTEEYISYNKTDPAYLYGRGFVDDEKFSLSEWEAAFGPFLHASGNYFLNLNDFVSLGKYKFHGWVRKPLNVMEMRDGWYELEVLKTFFYESLLPSTSLGKVFVDNLLKRMEQGPKGPDGLHLIKDDFKRELQNCLDQYPSIRRIRELSVYKLTQDKISSEKTDLNTATVKSQYKTGAKIGEKEKKDLSNTLLKPKQIKASAAAEVETFSIKDLQKRK